MREELYLSDGTVFVDLITRRNGWFLKEWIPATPEAKGGGIFQDSPLSAGRRLVLREYSNAFENMTLAARGGTQDQLIFETQQIRRLLEKAVTYWTSEWQQTPVYLIARAPRETNLRYAMLYDYRAPGDTNPFASPFASFTLAAAMDGFELLLERGNWQDVAPGESVCVALSGTQTVNTQESFYPEASLDDVYVLTSSGTLFNTSRLKFGNDGGGNLYTGIRFIGLTIPPGSTIVRAFVKLQAPDTSQVVGNANILITGEDSVTPAIFSTYADFVARDFTIANVNWGTVPIFGIGETFITPDVTAIIQETIEMPGWASGNNLVLFIRNNGSTTNVLREAASFNNAVYASPELVVVYDSPNTLGRTATCLLEVYLANKRTQANITDVYYLDASSATFSANIMTASYPTALFPAVPAAGDILYILLDSTVAGSLVPFASVVWDILAAQSGITGVAYEYYNGAWVALTIRDNTASGGIPFSLTGVNSMHWKQPSDWTFVAINGITGFGIRIRITSVSGPTPPTQQNRAPYSVTWPNVDIDAAQVAGDLPALARHKIFNQSATSGDLSIMRAIVGLRSVSRGVAFTSVLNFSDVQNPPGIDGVISGSPNASIVGDARSPAGRCFKYAVAGADPLTAVGTVQIANTISGHFYGRYRAFVRLTVDTGTANDIGIQLSYAEVDLPTVYLPFIDEWLLVDMGQIVIPGSSILQNSDIFSSFFFTISLIHGVDVDVKFYDLWLIPIDEWAGDISGTSNVNQYLDIDSIFYPKAATPARIFSRQVSDNDVVSIGRPNTPQQMIYQANTDQQVHMLTAIVDTTTGEQQSFGYVASKIQSERIQQYLSMRGRG